MRHQSYVLLFYNRGIYVPRSYEFAHGFYGAAHEARERINYNFVAFILHKKLKNPCFFAPKILQWRGICAIIIPYFFKRRDKLCAERQVDL